MTESPLDAAADRLARRLLAAHPPTHAYGRAAVAGLPAAVARILSLGLDHTADTLAHPRSPWLDDASPAVASVQDAWAEAVRGAVRYPPEAWTEAVTTAAHVALRLLVHPADGLAAVAFDRDPAPRPAAEVLARVRAATPYAYLPDVAARYADRKEIGVLDRDALARLLARIERRMSDTLSPADWLALAEPLLDTVGPDGDPPGTVDAALVRAFFEARGHGGLVAGLPDGPVSRAALLAFLDAPDAFASADAVPDAALPAAEKPSPAVSPLDASPADRSLLSAPEIPELPPVVEASAARPSVTLPPPVPATPAPVAPPLIPAEPPPGADDEPLWRRLARQHAASAPSPAEVAAPSSEGAPLWQRFSDDATIPPAAVPVSLTASAPSSDAPSLAVGVVDGRALDRRVLGDAAAERDLFVAALFGGDVAAYEATLAALDAAPTWTAATQIIARDIFHRPGVDMYGETALAFTDAVQTAKDRA